MSTNEPLTYKSSGVDIDQANSAVRGIREIVRSTFTPNVLSDIGLFGGLFKADFAGMNEPVLVSSIDGVGTKTKVAQMAGIYDGVGYDIVNHCIDDILVQGARPLFFMDYFGTGGLKADVLSKVVDGIAGACRAAGCALLAGETAEMPGMYAPEDFDLVGSIVGVVDREKIMPKGDIMPGDVLIGLESSGLHTNGFTLARKALFEVAGYTVDQEFSELGTTLGKALLSPHRCYLNELMPLIQNDLILAMAHITGGGFFDNIPRVMPSNCSVSIDTQSWQVPPLFQMIQSAGNVPKNDMYRTFNMGIGMIVVCRRETSETILSSLSETEVRATIVGEVTRGAHDVQVI